VAAPLVAIAALLALGALRLGDPATILRTVVAALRPSRG